MATVHNKIIYFCVKILCLLSGMIETAAVKVLFVACSNFILMKITRT